MTRRGSPMPKSRRPQTRRACAAFLQRTLRVVSPPRRHAIRRLLTDNGDGLSRRARFAGVCRTWAVRHRFTRPYRPQTNGKAERFIQTLLREWAYRVPYRSSARRTAALAPVSPLLQPPASTREPRPSLAVDAFPRGCLR